MTHDSDQDTTKSQNDNAGAEPPKRAKRLARTLSLSIPPVSEAKPGDSAGLAKTLIDADVQNSGTASPDELQLPPAAPSKKPKSQVAKTKLFSDGPELAGSEAKVKRRPSQQFVARTLLDHSMILQARSQYSVKEGVRLEKAISERALEPQKIIEPIDAKRKVRECPFSWNDQGDKERLKHCTRCQTTIYNFEGMEQSQAEALVFKRENHKKFVLYKRSDGKFMTSDCPLAVKQRHQLIGLVAVCVCVIACIGGFLITMPPPPPPSTSDNQPFVAPPEAVPTGPRSSQKTTSPVVDHGKSLFHYEAGQPLPPSSVTNDASNSQTPKTYTDSEEKGDFWQFPNGQPADAPR